MVDEALKTEILARQSAGQLFDWIVKPEPEGPQADQPTVVNCLLGLAADGDLDLLAILTEPAANWSWDEHFLTRQRLFTLVIPSIEAPSTRMMDALGGVEDGTWRYFFDEVFLKWCSNKRSRPDEVLAVLDGGGEVPDHFLLGALIAGLRSATAKYVQRCSTMLATRDPSVVPVAAKALAAMPASDDVAVRQAIHALADVVEESGAPSEHRARALEAAFRLAAGSPAIVEPILRKLIDVAAQDADAAILDTFADAFGSHALTLPEDILGTLADTLTGQIAKENRRSGSIDMGLHRMLSGSNRDEAAISLFGRMLLRELDSDGLGRGSTAYELSNGNPKRLAGLAVRWLLSGEPALCHAVEKLVQGIHVREASLENDFAEIPLTDAQALYLARKAVGWLLLKPVAAASITVSLLRNTETTQAGPLGELLFDPILLNYPGQARKYLERVAPSLSGAGASAVAEALARHDAYLEALRDTGEIPELHPSERHRRIQMEKRRDEMVSIHRDAEGQSVLLSIIHKSLLLHGVRCVSYVRDFDGTDRRLDNKLGTVSTEMERAMQFTFDPLGLEHFLETCRRERPPS